MALVPQGVNDTLLKDSEKKDRAISRLKKLFRSYGYAKIETPIFEYYDTFFEIKNAIDIKNTLKIVDNDGQILALRPDTTTPIVRSVATNYEDAKDYLKLFYNMNVYRSSKTRDQRREETQVGIEYIGQNSSFVDCEVISLAIKSLDIGNEFQIDIGHSQYILSLLEGIEDTEEKERIKRFVANKNFIDLENALSTSNLDEVIKKAILNLPYLYGKMEDLESNIVIVNEKSQKAIGNLKETYALLKEMNLHKNVSFDLGMAQDLNYYSGIIFRGYVKGLYKPVLSGGRYGNIISANDHEFSGVGFGIDIDSFITEVQVPNTNSNRATVIGEDPILVMKKSEELRKSGMIVESMLNGFNVTETRGTVIKV